MDLAGSIPVTRRVFLQPIITVCTKGESLAQLVRTTIAIAATEGGL
jgi:hypothetical protein